eukprot:3473429-Pyramimonas_sp.AAC.1
MIGYLERSCTLSWALRGPLGVILGEKKSSDTSRVQIQGRGRRRGQPLPEGEEGSFERKTSIEHLHPEGWWDRHHRWYLTMCRVKLESSLIRSAWSAA